MKKYLIIGLGNIGEEYNFTRHNIGFDIADVFVAKNKGTFSLEKLAFKSEIKIKGKSIIVIKPTTYMNLSGKAFKYWMDKENIPIENTLTLVDDFAIPLEAIRIKAAGSDAGHNGLKDIAATLGHVNYAKLRFGIGSNFNKGAQVNFVLGKWQAAEIEPVKQKLMICADALESFVLQGLDATMNQFNKIKVPL
jgi:peptidyl-tRNA hydrolase, PTH1 family